MNLWTLVNELSEETPLRRGAASQNYGRGLNGFDGSYCMTKNKKHDSKE